MYDLLNALRLYEKPGSENEPPLFARVFLSRLLLAVMSRPIYFTSDRAVRTEPFIGAAEKLLKQKVTTYCYAAGPM